MQIYLAAPLFSEAEKQFNSAIAKLILKNCPDIKMFLPQAIAFKNSQQIFEDCKKRGCILRYNPCCYGWC